MTYYPDMTDYRYFSGQIDGVTKNVGWLDDVHNFPTGVCKPETIDILWSFCQYSVNHTRGLHICPFCAHGNIEEHKGAELLLGSSEIRVFSEYHVYAAPTLIFHYIVRHKYLPPPDFIQALHASELPPSKNYLVAIERMGLICSRTDMPEE